jgi:hypothetical protein
MIDVVELLIFGGLSLVYVTTGQPTLVGMNEQDGQQTGHVEMLIA